MISLVLKSKLELNKHEQEIIRYSDAKKEEKIQTKLKRRKKEKQETGKVKDTFMLLRNEKGKQNRKE